jgi:hypothetical protein
VGTAPCRKSKFIRTSLESAGPFSYRSLQHARREEQDILNIPPFEAVAEIPDPDLMLSLARHLKGKKNYSMAAYVDTREISDTSKHSTDNHNLKFYVPSPNDKKLASFHDCERRII